MKVMVEQTKNDDLKHDANYNPEIETSFQKKLREARANREERKRKLIEFLNDPEVQAYYNNPENILY